MKTFKFRRLIILGLLIPQLSFAEAKINPFNKNVIDDIAIAQQNLQQIDSIMKNQMEAVNSLQAKMDQLKTKISSGGQLSKSGANATQLKQAVNEIQESFMSFNLQYLQLQSQMQHENRSYTAISNIMKTKHDTVKNSISNVR